MHIPGPHSKNSGSDVWDGTRKPHLRDPKVRQTGAICGTGTGLAMPTSCSHPCPSTLAVRLERVCVVMPGTRGHASITLSVGAKDMGRRRLQAAHHFPPSLKTKSRFPFRLDRVSIRPKLKQGGGLFSSTHLCYNSIWCFTIK